MTFQTGQTKWDGGSNESCNFSHVDDFINYHIIGEKIFLQFFFFLKTFVQLKIPYQEHIYLFFPYDVLPIKFF